MWRWDYAAEAGRGAAMWRWDYAAEAGRGAAVRGGGTYELEEVDGQEQLW
jgi:hypothetical protein